MRVRVLVQRRQLELPYQLESESRGAEGPVRREKARECERERHTSSPLTRNSGGALRRSTHCSDKQETLTKSTCKLEPKLSLRSVTASWLFHSTLPIFC